jgi:hypothetical protein
MVHPHPRVTSTHSCSLLASISHLHAQSHKNPTPHRTGDLRISLDPPSLRYIINPFTLSYNDLHLAIQVLDSMHEALQFLIT